MRPAPGRAGSHNSTNLSCLLSCGYLLGGTYLPPTPERWRCRLRFQEAGLALGGSGGVPSRGSTGEAALESAARMPCNSAVGVGGQPGIATSTGMTFATRHRLA